MTTVRVTHLELRSPEVFRPPSRGPENFTLVRPEAADPELSRFLYTEVGADYSWTDRLAWTNEQWIDWLDRPEVEIWVAYESGAPIGYFELEAQAGGSVEIVYFGLLPAFTGRGLGGRLLTHAVGRAFSMRPSIERVWLHTCTLDHPAALAGYLARGFTIFLEEDEP